MSAFKAPRPVGKDAKSQHLQVFVRVRPLLEQELSHRSHSAVVVKGPKEIVVNDHTTPKIAKTYTFDGVFGPEAKQADIYNRAIGSTISDVLAGYNCTTFAYGQTGSGKTYTLEGNLSEGDLGSQAGIIPRAMSALFDELRLQMAEFTVRISFVELYNEELYDLLSAEEVPPKLRLFDDPTKKGSVVVQSLEEKPVHSKSQVLEFLKKGLAKRQVAATQMNAQSSRSHTVFCATVHTKENNVEGEELVKYAKLYLVDLAGSENIGRSGSVDKRAREAGSINQSLLTLGRVISCLVERQPHVPYRESKLTRILQDSLGGRTKTTIIATVSPASSNVEETLSTLDYALKAKSVSNKPEVNQKVSKEAVLKEYAVMIDDLKKKLDLTREGSGIYIAPENYQSVMEQLEARNKDLVEKIAEIRVCVNEIRRHERIFEDLSIALKSKEQQLSEVKDCLDQTKESVVNSKFELEVAREKLADTIELVDKTDQYENHVQKQAENLLSIVEECQEDSQHLRSKVKNSRSILQNNIQYASALCDEMDRIRDSYLSKLSEFHLSKSSLDVLCQHLRTLKDDGNREFELLKERAYSARDQFISTLEKLHAASDDQIIYNTECNNETLKLAKLCEERLKQLTLLDEGMKSCFECYKDFTKTVILMKNAASETILEVQIVWLKLLDEVSKTCATGVRDATDVFINRVNEGEEVLKTVVASSKHFSQIQDKVAKDRSLAVNELLQDTLKFEKLLEDQDVETASAMAQLDERIEGASDLWRTSEQTIVDGVEATSHEANRVINELSFSATSMTRAISKHTEGLLPKIDSLKSTVRLTEESCEEVCTNMASGWATLVSDAEDRLEARGTQSKTTLQIEETCLDEVLQDLKELENNYANDGRKLYDRVEEFLEESSRSFDSFARNTSAIRSDFEDQLTTQSTLVRTFVDDQFKRDRPSGETPPRKDMRIPSLHEPLASPDVRRITRKVDEDLTFQ